MLRGEVLARWQEFVGTGELLRGLQSRVGRIRDRVASAFTGRPLPDEEVADAVESSVESLVRAAADRAAERTAEAWRGRPGGAALLGASRTVGGRAPDLRDFAERSPRPGLAGRRAQPGVLAGRPAPYGGPVASFGVNGAGLAVMLLVFAQTGGLTGAEVLSPAARRRCPRRCWRRSSATAWSGPPATQARHDLMERVEKLLAGEEAAVPHARARRRAGPGAARGQALERAAAGASRSARPAPRRRRRVARPASRAVLALGGVLRTPLGRPAGGARPGRRARRRAARPAAGRRRPGAGKAGARLRLGGAHRGRGRRGHRQRQVLAGQRAGRGERSARSGYAGRRPSRGPRWSGAPTAPARCWTGWRSRAGTPPSRPAAYAADGLVLLDLPDFDSVRSEHRLEVDRLVELVDLLVWVLDPQKYADAALHDRYLRPLAGHGDVTLVVLNQADLLDPAALDACLADLRRLLADDGLPDVPVLAASALTGEGLDALREELTGAARRGGGAAADGGRPRPDRGGGPAAGLGGPPRTGIGGQAQGALVDALDAAAGTTIAAAVDRAHRARRPRSPAGRSPAGCGGCGRTRCAGCTWTGPAPRPSPVYRRPTTRVLTSRTPRSARRCPRPGPSNAPAWSLPCGVWPTTPQPGCPTRGPPPCPTPPAHTAAT